MRFAAKMTALITMLLAVSLAVGGYLVMSSSFVAAVCRDKSAMRRRGYGCSA